jgi:hypothetical protein
VALEKAIELPSNVPLVERRSDAAREHRARRYPARACQQTFAVLHGAVLPQNRHDAFRDTVRDAAMTSEP